ncbi:MAG: VWA domain-containing protein [Actinobacteria bacterium]|nr:VWA domain-containing protein [Actinomycetota bacterium]
MTTAALAVAGPVVAQTDGLQIEQVSDEDYPAMELTVTVPAQLADVALPPDAFEISENGEPRGRPSLGRSGAVAEPAAPRTVLAIDTSGSMRGPPIQRALAAAADFVRSLRPGSEVAVVAFGDRPSVITDFTSDVGVLLDSIASIEVDPAAETALYDGVQRANRLLARGPDDVPRSIVVLSDGGDTVTPGALDTTVADLETGGATVWTVQLQSGESNPEALAALAGSPDRVLSAANADELQTIYVALASDVSRQYLLRYDSDSSGKTTITVDVDYGVVTASNSVEAVIDGTVTQKPAEPVRIASPDPFTVTVPLLGTSPAYRLGLVSLLAAALLLTWVIVSRPPTSSTRERLLISSATQQERGLTVIASWVTEQADRRLRERQLGEAIDRALENAGLNVRTGELVVGVLSIMMVAYAIGLTLAGPLMGVALALLVPIGTRLLLSIRREKRQAAFAEQFIDVLQLLAGSLRAGYGLLQGIDSVSRDAQEPAAGEFRRILIEHRLGRDMTEAMNNCAMRMGNKDFAWVVQAISIHREVGGDLARVLDNIVGTVRERGAVQRQVRALSAEGRMSSVVLTALPFVTLFAISAVSPGYIGELTSRPVGWALVGIAGTMLLIGTLIIRRMVKIQY